MKLVFSFSCAICLMDFEVGEECKTLPCVHIYHAKCIDQVNIWGGKKKKLLERVRENEEFLFEFQDLFFYS